MTLSNVLPYPGQIGVLQETASVTGQWNSQTVSASNPANYQYGPGVDAL